MPSKALDEMFAANSGNQVTGMAKMMFWVSHHSYQPWFPAEDYSYPTYLCAAPWPDGRQPHLHARRERLPSKPDGRIC